MTTPNFKLLANAIRLGQPPDPALAIKVLVEVIQQQDSEIGELRQKLSLLTSRLQFLDAKTARLEGTAPAPTRSASIPLMPPIPAPAATGNLAAHRSQERGLSQDRQQQEGRKRRGAGVPIVNAEEDSQEGLGSTLSVPKADLEAVVQRAGDQGAPYPIAPAGVHRSTEVTGMPFKRAADPSPIESAHASHSRPPGPPSVPYIAIEESVADETFAMAEAGGASRPIEPPRSAGRQLERILDESSYDDSQMTSVLKRRPDGDGG